MQPVRLIVALTWLNLSLFVTTVAFLPRAGSYSWSTAAPLDYIINSRTHWEIAWLMLLAGILASAGIFVLAARPGTSDTDSHGGQ